MNKTKEYLQKIKFWLRGLTYVYLGIYLFFSLFLTEEFITNITLLKIIGFVLIPLTIVFIPFIISFFIEKREKNLWIFLVVMGIIISLNFPIGTFFGVILLIYLFKKEVKEYYYLKR